MPIAELYDGTRLEFPEGTDPAVIQKTVKDQTWLRQNIEERGKTDWGRAGAQMVGGAVGGAIGALTPIPGDELLGMGMGDAIGGLAYDSYRRHVLGKDQDKTTADYAVDAAVDTTMGAAVPKVIEGAAPYVKGAVKGALQPVKSSVARKAAKGVGAGAADDLAMFERHGFKPDVGMVTDNPATHSLSQSIRRTPGGGSIMARNDAYNYAVGQGMADDIARKLGNPQSKSALGNTVKGAAEQSKASLQQQADQLFAKVERLLPNDTPIEASNTQALIGELEGMMQDPATAPIVGGFKSTLNGLKKSLGDDGTMTAKTAKFMKSMLGKVYRKADTDMVDGLNKRLYKALRDDINAAVAQQGDDAVAALDEANSFFRAFKGDKLTGKVGKEQALDEIIKQANSGDIYRVLTSKAAGDADKLKRTFDLLPEGVADDVRATVFQQMGRANAGAQSAAGDAFSFNSFLTNVNKLSPEAKGVLFRGKPSVAKDFDDLLKVSEFMKALEKSANHSNTDNLRMWREVFKPIEQGVLLGGTGGSFGGASGVLKGAAVGAGVQGARVGYQYRMGRLLTNPDFVRWLAQGGKQALKPAQKGTNLYTHLAKLPVIAKANPEIKGEIDAYLNQFDAPIKRQ